MAKIEELQPHFKTALQALRYGLEISDKEWDDKKENCVDEASNKRCNAHLRLH